MRFETIDAFDRLVSTYVSAIEATGTKIPEETVALLASDPFAACEALNSQALSCHAITPELDALLEALWESMDAEDTRSEPTPEACERAVAAYTNVHVEIVEPEPEPEPEDEPAESPEGEEAAEDAAEEGKGRKRRQRRNRKEDAEQADAPESNGTAEASTDETQDDTKSKKRTRKSKATKADSAASDASDATTDEQPKKAKRTRKTKASEAKPEDATNTQASDSSTETSGTPFEGDALTVDQALAILGCSRPKLTKMIESGELPAYKKGRSWQVSAAAVLDKAAGN